MRKRPLAVVGAIAAAVLVTLAAGVQPHPRPAVRIEPPQPQLGPEYAVGAGPIVLRYAEWQSDSTFDYEFGTGRISGIVRLRPPSYEIVSLDHDSFVAGYLYPRATSQVGDRVDPGALVPDIQPDGSDANLDPSYWVSQECYVPLYLRGSPGSGGQPERHVCAFVLVRVEQIHPPPGYGGEPGDLFMRITKLPNRAFPGTPWVARRNASARFDGTQPPVVFPNSSLGWSDLFAALNFLPPVPSGPTVLLPDARVYVR